VALQVRPPALAGGPWIQLGGGFSDALLLRAEAGGHFGAGWWGLGTQLDSGLSGELGIGLAHRWGRWGGRLGLWGGVDRWRRHCIACTVTEEVDSEGNVEIHSSGAFAGPPREPGWSALGRLRLELRRPLAGPVALSGGLGLAASARGLRPEGTVAVVWSGR
jgi:hypothetical protein